MVRNRMILLRNTALTVTALVVAFFLGRASVPRTNGSDAAVLIVAQSAAHSGASACPYLAAHPGYGTSSGNGCPYLRDGRSACPYLASPDAESGRCPVYSPKATDGPATPEAMNHTSGSNDVPVVMAVPSRMPRPGAGDFWRTTAMYPGLSLSNAAMKRM